MHSTSTMIEEESRLDRGGDWRAGFIRAPGRLTPIIEFQHMFELLILACVVSISVGQGSPRQLTHCIDGGNWEADHFKSPSSQPRSSNPVSTKSNP